jgi:hypothetical protein
MPRTRRARGAEAFDPERPISVQFCCAAQRGIPMW